MLFESGKSASLFGLKDLETGDDRVLDGLVGVEVLRVVVEAVFHLLAGDAVELEDAIVATYHMFRQAVVAVARLNGINALLHVGVGEEGGHLFAVKHALGQRVMVTRDDEQRQQRKD